MTSRHFPGTRVVACLIVTLFATSFAVASPAAAATAPDGYRLLDGRDAREFRLPFDVRPVRTWHDSHSGLTYERYQQVAAPLGVHVEGAQLTVVRRGGRTELVLGAHYPGLRASGAPPVDATRAIAAAASDRSIPGALRGDVSELLTRRADLRLDPDGARLFYLVESSGPGVRLFHEIDASSGAVIDAWDALGDVDGMGTGVKADRKSLLGADAGTADNLTSKSGGSWRMQSVDGRFITYDAKGRGSYGPGSGLQPMSDNAKSAWRNDNDWKAPAQGAAVDAQYYAAQTDRFYRQELGFDFVGGCPFGPVRSVVRFDPYAWDGVGYDNAFWDGQYLVYGDGDGYTTGGFAGAHDVVAHELSHAVTECRAPLEYMRQPGALNESFSDIMGLAAEWQLNEPNTSNCRRESDQSLCADWWMGEDALISGTPFGFRSAADPALGDQPSHFASRFTGSYDNYGVHINSGIPNHAFYLMVNGGRNARCASPNDALADCDVYVPAIPTTDAQRIVFHAWGLLGYKASFCHARDATVAAAELLFPGSALHRSSAELAWAAVGRRASDCSSLGESSFRLGTPTRSISLAAGTTGQLQLQVQRGSNHSSAVQLSVESPSPIEVSLSPAQVAPGGSAATATITVPPDASSATYALSFSATDGSATRRAAATVVVDGTSPQAVVSSVQPALLGTVATNGTVPIEVRWQASDAGSGVATAHLQHNAGGGWSGISQPGTTGGTTATVASAGTHGWRVTASDFAGNSTTSAVLPRSLATSQESAATFAGSWASHAAGTAWGTTRFSKTAGAQATFNFTGTEVAWVASRAPKRGKAKVYLDGVLTKVDLYAPSLQERRIVFRAAGLPPGTHTLRIVINGTSGRPRVDVDGFVVLAP